MLVLLFKDLVIDQSMCLVCTEFGSWLIVCFLKVDSSKVVCILTEMAQKRRDAVVFVPKLAAAAAATCKHTTMHAAICYL
jgi:hypothetical protein